MRYNVILFPAAQRDMSRAFRWLIRHTPAAAGAWHQEISEAIDRLETFPARCPLARENPHYREEIRRLLCGQYRLIFTIRQREGHILRIRHSAQKTLKPKNRTRKPLHP
jgi:plasmid stabilization system protein ParE